MSLQEKWPKSRLSEGIPKDPEERLEWMHAVFRQYYPGIVQFLRRRGVDFEEAEDLAQEVMLRIYKSKYSGESSLATFVFATTSNVWKNFLRSRSTTKRSGIEVEISAGLEAERSLTPAEGEEKLIAAERLRRLREAVKDLPEQQRVSLKLWMEGNRYASIADKMNISVNTVKSHVMAAKRALQGALGSKYD